MKPVPISNKTEAAWTDRDFSAGIGNWIHYTGDDITFDNISMNWNCDELNNIRLPITFTEGVIYRIGFDIIAYTSGHLVLYVGKATPGYNISETVGTFTLYIEAGDLDYFRFSAGTFIGSIDNMSIKQITDYAFANGIVY